MKKILILFLLTINFSLLQGQTGSNEKLNLHVASPKWEDQVIYFLMIDRFADGDTATDQQAIARQSPLEFFPQLLAIVRRDPDHW